MDKTISKKKEKWYIGGLSFECIGCGSCCSGPDEGFIWLKKAEITMLADHLGLTVKQVTKKYLRKIVVRYSIIEEPRTKDCIFLIPHGNGKGCEVYNSRPNQCRTWPFWRENLTKKDWEGPIAQCCPGVGKGPIRSKEEIEKAAKERDDAYGIDF